MVQVRLSTMLHEVSTDFRLQKRSPLSLCSISKIYPPYPNISQLSSGCGFRQVFNNTPLSEMRTLWRNSLQLVICFCFVFSNIHRYSYSYTELQFNIFFFGESSIHSAHYCNSIHNPHSSLREQHSHCPLLQQHPHYFLSIHSAAATASTIFQERIAFTVPQQQHPQSSLR